MHLGLAGASTFYSATLVMWLGLSLPHGGGEDYVAAVVAAVVAGRPAVVAAGGSEAETCSAVGVLVMNHSLAETRLIPDPSLSSISPLVERLLYVFVANATNKIAMRRPTLI